jgi:hypothetical protein
MNVSGETEERPSGWTTDTLKDMFLRLIDEHDHRYQQRFQAQEQAVRDALAAQEKQVAQALLSAQQAVNKAETAAERRFESVNEFRAQLSDQVATFVRREYLDSQLDALDRRLADQARERQNALDQARTLTDGLLPREVYETFASQSAADRQVLRDRIGTLEGELKAARRASTAYVTAVGFGVTALTIALSILTLFLR